MIRKPTYEELEQRVRELERKAARAAKAEGALQESENRYKTLLHFAPYPIAVFTLDGRVSYLNSAFTETFGWSLEEVEGKELNYFPPEWKHETTEEIRQLLEKRAVLREETRRCAKDGRILDVIVRAAAFSVSDEEPEGVLVILRDVTREKRTAQANEVMLRISLALPEHPELGDLLYYVNTEVRRVLGTEGATVVLLDELKGDLFIVGAAYDDADTERRTREIRFSMDELMAGRVIKTGEPMIVPDTSRDRQLHEERDRRLGYKTRNLALVPLKSSERVIGALCAVNKKEGIFQNQDIELLSMIAGTVALSVENVRFSEELRKAYREVISLNRAKDRVINHLSHELKTPVAILSGSMNSLAGKLVSLPDHSWKRTLERVQRNLERIVDIQHQVHDIMENKQYKVKDLLSVILDECADEIETLVAEQYGEVPLVDHIRRRIEEIYSVKEAVSRETLLEQAVKERLEVLKPHFSHRDVEIATFLEPTTPIFIPPEVLRKVFDGLLKNAMENTPDEGKIEVSVRKRGDGVELVVQDYGVGIPEEAQRRIFEGFFTTRDTMAYSSKRPFDFNAGGKGADLLRMRIFSERYHFDIRMVSTRCPYIPNETDLCPGRISECLYCSEGGECYRSAGTVFTLYFPPAPVGEVTPPDSGLATSSLCNAGVTGGSP